MRVARNIYLCVLLYLFLRCRSCSSTMVWATTRTFDDGDLFAAISELLSEKVSQHFSSIWRAIAIWVNYLCPYICKPIATATVKDRQRVRLWKCGARIQWTSSYLLQRKITTKDTFLLNGSHTQNVYMRGSVKTIFIDIWFEIRMCLAEVCISRIISEMYIFDQKCITNRSKWFDVCFK